MKAKANQSKIALYIPAVVGERYSEYRTLSPYFVTIGEDGEIRNLYWSYTDGEAQFEYLRFHCQWEKAKSELRTYGERLEYRNVDLQRPEKALQMARMLRRAQKVRERFPVAPATFGQFVTMLAAGLGVKQAVLPTGSFPGYSYSESRHQILKIGEESQRAIDRVIEESWKADHPEPVLEPVVLTLPEPKEVA